jgi:uncharacterized protein with HEPN domain
MDRDKAYLRDILDACRRIIGRTAGFDLNAFTADEDVQDIVMRQMTVLGEAARLVSENTRKRFPEVPWHQIAGMRNRLAHEYREIDFEEVWITVERDIPTLASQVERILAGV